MENVLRTGAVDAAGRAQLREHRMQHGIDALRHLHVLRKLGWNLDDFEEGHKGVYPEVCQDYRPFDPHRMTPLMTQVLAAEEKDEEDNGRITSGVDGVGVDGVDDDGVGDDDEGDDDAGDGDEGDGGEGDGQ